MKRKVFCRQPQIAKEHTAPCTPLSEETEMPLFKGVAGKATPHKAIAYITRKDKAKFIAVQNLFVDEDYSEQFKETVERFGKCADFGERKYYHFKLSPDRADNADPRRGRSACRYVSLSRTHNLQTFFPRKPWRTPAP